MIVERGVAGRIAAAFVHSKLTPLIDGGIPAAGPVRRAGAAAGGRAANHRADDRRVRVDARRVARGSGAAADTSSRETAVGDSRRRISLLHVQSRARPCWSSVSWSAKTKIARSCASIRSWRQIRACSRRAARLRWSKLRSIDDVPVMALTLWGERYDDFQLRRLAGQLHDSLKEIPDVSEVTIIGGRPRQVTVEIDTARLAAYRIDPLMVRARARLVECPAGGRRNRRGRKGARCVQTGQWIASLDAVGDVVVATRERGADARARRRAGRGRRRRARQLRDVCRARRPLAACRHHQHREAARHQRHRDCLACRREARRRSRRARAVGRRTDRHAQLRRNGARQIERAAVAHAARRRLGGRAHLARARLARGGGRVDGDSRDPRADALRLLPVRLHAEPDHAVRADLLHRHPRGRRDRGGGEHRASRANGGRVRP